MRSSGFLTGVIAGAALGAVVMMAVDRRLRRPVMEGIGDAADAMKPMWGSGDEGQEPSTDGDAH